MIVSVPNIERFSSSRMEVEEIRGISSQTNVIFDLDFESNYQDGGITSPQAESCTSDLTVQPVDVHIWTADTNTRFKELAREEAIRDLSIAELAELDSLTRLRRLAVYPRSADEIIWERRQQKLTRSLIHALEAYVEFHESARDS